MKTSELTGAALDCYVAKADGLAVDVVGQTVLADRGTAENYAYRYTPSTDWAQGGPIIERQRIAVFMMKGKWAAAMPLDDGIGPYSPHYWLLEITDVMVDATGPTPLLAAMRAYVASKFGDEVPDA